MPRQARLDPLVPFIIVRGIEKRRIIWMTVKTDRTLCLAWVGSPLKP